MGESAEIVNSRALDQALKFAAMICLYENNVADEVREALESAFDNQTLSPDQLIAVFDGFVPPDVEKVIEEFEKHIDVQRIIFSENRGHGQARAAAIKSCGYEWIAIIDADDISLPDRFETLFALAAVESDATVIGGALTEFHMENGVQKLGATRVFPETPDDTRRVLGTRSPVAQPTAILRVPDILAAGNYRTWFNNEDYYLWIRLVVAGCKIRNVAKPLILYRTSPSLYARRGGYKYWHNEVALQYFSLRQGTTTLGQFVFGAGFRFFVQVLLPNNLRGVFYKFVLRRL